MRLMRFVLKSSNPRIINAVLEADELLNWDGDLMKEIYEKDDFKYNSGSGKDIARKLNQGLRSPVVVTTFTYWNPFSSMIGRFHKGQIQVNSRKLPLLSDKELVGHILHEFSHACGFSHGDNYPSEEKNKHSVPYYLSVNVGNWL